MSGHVDNTQYVWLLTHLKIENGLASWSQVQERLSENFVRVMARFRGNRYLQARILSYVHKSRGFVIQLLKRSLFYCNQKKLSVVLRTANDIDTQLKIEPIKAS